MLFSESIRNLSKWVQTSKKCSTLSLSIWQEGQVSLWMRVFLVLHVTKQFKSKPNLVNICRISGLRICVIYGPNSTPSFNDDNTRKRDVLWALGDFGDIDRQIVEWTFYGRCVHYNSEDWAIYRENRLYITYIAHFIQSWLAVFASRNASLRMAFPVPFSKRSQYLTAKPHALCIIGQRPNSAFTAFLLAYLLTYSVL